MRPLPSFVTPALTLAAFALTIGCTVEPGSPREERLGVVSSAATTDITEVTGFGSNPGALKMYEHVPASLKPSAATVVVLHGCMQGAADAAKLGWNDLSEQHGFTLVFPEQQTGNNPLRCFNWSGEYGDPTNLQRGKGENLSIKQMIDKSLAAHGGDPKKIYVVGFSAGGAEAVLMAAVYPDVFAGAASIAGIPYNCTTVYAEVSGCQKPGKNNTPDVWGKKVKDAFAGFAGPWPRMSVWQGDADSIVGTANRGEIVEQWTNLFGLDAAAPSLTDTVDGQAHSAWKDSGGNVVVETYTIAGMDHGVPIKGGAQCGTPSQYTLDKGICAAAHIAEFFGLTGTTPSTSSSSGGADAGSSGKPASSSSSSSSSTGGASSSSGGTSESGATPSDGDTGYGTASSTCAFAPSRARASFAFVALAALGLALGRRARRARRA